jgi:peptidoglycan/LPS O-acetylase OafA/YrhL
VVVAAATILASHTLRDLWRGLPYVAFLQSKPNLPTRMPPFSEVRWSFATEVQFYVLLPLIALAFGRSRRVTLALFAGYAVAYLAVAVGLVLLARAA